MASIFTKIITGEIPCYKIEETEDCLAFLDISPLSIGHALVIPKKEVDFYYDLDDNLFQKVNDFAKKVSHAIKKTVPCERIGVAVIGLEVPHAHIHLVPLNNVSDINFERPKLKFTESEMKEVASLIKSAI